VNSCVGVNSCDSSAWRRTFLPESPPAGAFRALRLADLPERTLPVAIGTGLDALAPRARTTRTPAAADFEPAIFTSLRQGVFAGYNDETT
jgi:hypothetical protein